MTQAPQYSLVQTNDELTTMLQHLAGVSELCLDTEADSMHHYVVRLCLIQISSQNQHWIVDPLSPHIDLSPLWEAPAMQKLIIHGADYDLRMLYNVFGFSPTEVFDTMIAAKFLAEERVGLAHLVKKHFDVQLEKDNQKADWTIRPLPEDMKQYAILDTFYLKDLKDILQQQLQEKQRTHWVIETCAQIVKNCRDNHFMEEDAEKWRIKGSMRLHSHELAYLKELWFWREAQAKAMDRPPFKVLHNEAMVYLARVAAAIAPDFSLDRLPKLPRNFMGDRLESLLNILKKTSKLSPDQYPPRKRPVLHRPPSPDSNLLEHIRNLRDNIAGQYGIDPTLLANRHQMICLALPGSKEERRSKAGFLPWQWDLLKPALV